MVSRKRQVTIYILMVSRKWQVTILMVSHKWQVTIPNQKFIVEATSRIIGIHRSCVDLRRRPSSAHHRLSNNFRLFPMPEVPLSRCWPSSEVPDILCFKIVGIPIKACAAQLSFNVFPLTNQYWHH